MESRITRRRRPPPITIPSLSGRDDKDNGNENSPKEKSPSPQTGQNPARPSTQTIQAQPSAPTTTRPSAVSASSKSSLPPTNIPLQPTTTSRRLTSTTTKAESPTRTTFITVTQSVPKEKQETPHPTQIIFVSLPPAVITVTAPGLVPAPAAETQVPLSQKPQATTALPSGAKIPIILLSVIGGLAMFFTAAVIIWRRKKRREEERLASQQMAERDDGGFRVIPDTRAILR